MDTDGATPGARIDIVAVRKNYGPVTALASVDLAVRSGEFMTLLGASGSGKTTLLMVLAGFIRPTSGSVLFDGREMVDVAPHLRNVGMVFQNYALFPHMSVRENIEFPLKLRKVPAAERRRKAEAVQSLVALDGYGGRPIDALSGGQRQRVALARAIAYDAPVLLLDEPLSALDKNLRETMQQELRHLHDRLGRTTISVTHDQREALSMSDRIAILDKGCIVQVGTPRELYQRPANRFVAGFLGETSFIDVTVEGARAMLGRITLVLDHAPQGFSGPALLALRPEQLTLLRDPADAPAGNAIPAIIRSIVYQGDSLQVQVALTGGTIVAVRQPASARHAFGTIEPGQALFVGVHPGDLLVLPPEPA